MLYMKYCATISHMIYYKTLGKTETDINKIKSGYSTETAV